MRKPLAVAALLVANASLVMTAPPAYAHCDDPHGAVERLVCSVRCYENPDPWKCPPPDLGDVG